MIFYRISRTAYGTPAAAFSGLGATVAAGRWNWAGPSYRAVYCSDTLALACLETLVHIRPLPRVFPPSVYFTIDVPDRFIESAPAALMPDNWDAEVPPSGCRDIGTTFLKSVRNVGLLVPTSLLPAGMNVLINPLHPSFSLGWVKGPTPFHYDGRLA